MNQSANAIIKTMINKAKAEHDLENAKHGKRIKFFTSSARTIGGSEVYCSCDPFGKTIRWKLDGNGSSKAKIKAFIESAA